MTGGSGSSDQALQAYLDDLLGLDDLHDQLRLDDAPGGAAAPAVVTAAPSTSHLPDNVTTLPSTPRPARAQPQRPYAEPIRTLNLRMPLPPLAPAETAAPESPAQPVAEHIVPPVAAPAVEPAMPRVEPAAPSEATVAVETEDLAAMAPPAPWLANGRPQWAQQPFECLLFRSGGLTLAAPLVELGSIYPLEDGALTSVFGQASWFMGLLPVKEYNARAIDTAQVVMPERYSESMRANYRYLLTLFGSDWALAVDAVVSTVVLDPDKVRWRGQRGKRPWLAGTVIDEMCALLDIAQLAWLFHGNDGKRQPAPA